MKPQNEKLLSAIVEGNLQRATEALLEGAEAGAHNTDGSSFLHIAVYYAKPEVVELLIKRGALVNLTRMDGATPLHLAVFQGSETIVSQLIDHGADVNVKNADGATPLMLGVVAGNLSCVRKLLQGGADVYLRKPDGSTALNLAGIKGDLSLILELASAAKAQRPRWDYSRIFKLVGDYVGVKAGWVKDKNSIENTEVILRDLHMETQLHAHKWINRLIGVFNPPSKLDNASGLLGDLTETDAEKVALSMEENGYHIFPVMLPSSDCDTIMNFAFSTKANLMPPLPSDEGPILYEPNNPVSEAYYYPEAKLKECAVIEKILRDQSLRAVAQAYLKCEPVIWSNALWWSTTAKRRSDAANALAQRFHFDSGANKSIVFFFYLTDVTPDTGAHVYIRGTNRVGDQPLSLLQLHGGVRLPDEVIAQHYGPDRIVEVCGPRGYILAIDQRGWHKGKTPVKGARLILSLSYSDSLLNKKDVEPVRDWEKFPELSREAQRHPRTYARYL